jgi:acyl-CoA thioesterase-2
VIAQALLAAYETVPDDRTCHSLHCYFIRPGDVRAPVLYQVDRARDGGSFTTRRVTAIQHGQQIFNLAASFQGAEEGYDHQFPAPAAPEPESLPTERELLKLKPRRRTCRRRWPGSPSGRGASRCAGSIRRPSSTRARSRRASRCGCAPRSRCRTSVRLQQATLAYASDLSFMETALRVHGLNFWTPGLQPASLDHAMWFHIGVDLEQGRQGLEAGGQVDGLSSACFSAGSKGRPMARLLTRGSRGAAPAESQSMSSSRRLR